MKVIYKYIIKEGYHNQVISTYAAAIPLSVGLDPSGQLCIWLLVDKDLPMMEATIHCVGTGQPLPHHDCTKSNYVGSVASSIYIWHIFFTL